LSEIEKDVRDGESGRRGARAEIKSLSLWTISWHLLWKRRFFYRFSACFLFLDAWHRAQCVTVRWLRKWEMRYIKEH